MDKIWIKWNLLVKKILDLNLEYYFHIKIIYYKGESENFKDYTYSYVHFGGNFENAATAAILVGLFGASNFWKPS